MDKYKYVIGKRNNAFLLLLTMIEKVK